MTRDSLSIVVPVTRMAGRLQNLNSWLLEALELGIEILLIHDVRDDATSEELNALIRSTKSQKLRLFEKSFGNQGAARNFGLAKATTSWIAFWDSDDLGAPKELLKLIVVGERNADVIIGQFRIIDSRGQRTYLSNDRILLQVPKNLGLWRMVFRRQLLSEIEFPELQMAEDQVFFGKVLSHSPKIQIVKHVIYTYVQGSPGQITKNREALLQIPQAIKQLKGTIPSTRNPTSKLIVMLMVVRLTIGQAKRTCLGRLDA